jgi:hypothetical protein
MKAKQAFSEKESSPWRGADLSKAAKSVTKAVESLISAMDKMSLEEIKQEFKKILDSESVNVSDEKKKYYRVELEKIHDRTQLMRFIVEIHFKGSKLSVNQ